MDIRINKLSQCKGFYFYFYFLATRKTGTQRVTENEGEASPWKEPKILPDQSHFARRWATLFLCSTTWNNSVPKICSSQVLQAFSRMNYTCDWTVLYTEYRKKFVKSCITNIYKLLLGWIKLVIEQYYIQYNQYWFSAHGHSH